MYYYYYFRNFNVWIEYIFPENFISLVIISFISTFLSLLLIVSLGISKEEYKIIVNKVKKQING